MDIPAILRQRLLFLALLVGMFSTAASAQNTAYSATEISQVVGLPHAVELPPILENGVIPAIETSLDADQRSDVYVALLYGVASAAVSVQFALTVSFINTLTTSGGPFDVHNVAVTTTLPQGATFHHYTIPQNFNSCSVENQTLTCTAPSVPAGASRDIVITVSTTQPGNFCTSVSSTSNTFDPNEGNNSASSCIQILAATEISGTIWHDLNGNGVLDPGEIGAPNVVVYIDSNNNGVFDDGEPTETTASDGTYTFGPVSDGTHVVRVFSSTYFTLAPSGGSRTVVVSGSSVTGQDFGVIIPITHSVFVFEDLNGNTTRDQNDPPMAGWELTMTGQSAIFASNNSTTSVSRSTNSDGFATFSTLRPGIVEVSSQQNATSHQSYPPNNAPLELTLISGTNGVSSTGFAAWTNPGIVTIRNYLDIDGSGTQNNGEITWGSFTFFIDLNGDKSHNNGEPTIPTTDGVGTYAPDILGDYSVCSSSENAFTMIAPVVDSCVDLPLRSGAPEQDIFFFTQSSLTISGIAFEDLDGSTTHENGEPFLANRRVYVDADLDEQFDELELSTTTSSLGFYELNVGEAGSYPVRIELLPSEFIVSPSNTYWISVVSDVSVVDQNFAVVEPISLSIGKRNDRLGNGLFGPEDLPIEGWPLTLTGQGPLFATQSPSNSSITSTSNSTGYVRFDNLLPGMVTVSEVQTATSHQSYPGDNAVIEINLISGQNVVNDGFLNWFTPGKISASLVSDPNGSGTQEPGESFLGGRTFWLETDGTPGVGPNEQTFLTASNSSATGTVPIEILPMNLCGDATGLTPISPQMQSNGWCVPLDIYSGSPEQSFVFFATVKTSTMIVLVYEDMDGDGTAGSSEPGIAGSTIQLERVTPDGNIFVSSSISTSSGQVAFGGLEPGTYHVISIPSVSSYLPSEPATRTRTITITGENPIETVTFGEYVPIQFGGFKFQDNNADGVHNQGDLIVRDWGIAIARSDGASPETFSTVSQTVTAVPSEGNGEPVYSFDGLAPGRYRISEIAQEGWTQTYPNAQNNPHLAIGQSPGVYVVNAQSGNSFLDLHFGNRPPIPTSIHGWKYVDLDANGIDNNEPRLNGVEFELVDGIGNVVATQTSMSMDVNEDGQIDPATEKGIFWFQNVTPGTYSLREKVPPGMSVTQPAGNSYDVTVVAGQESSIQYAFGNSANALDWGDLPAPATDVLSACPLPDPSLCYLTLAGAQGAAHVVVPQGVILGERIDAEGDGQPSFAADGDDNNASSQGGEDDEDGLLGFEVNLDGSIEFTVNISDLSGAGGVLDVFIDLNNDGVLNDGILPDKALEQVLTSVAVSAGTNVVSTTPGWVNSSSHLGYMRFRVSSVGGLGASGLAMDGEVEDYAFVSYDYGDAPSSEDLGLPTHPSGYPTTAILNGAYHRVHAGFQLGTGITSEAFALPTILADGDLEDDAFTESESVGGFDNGAQFGPSGSVIVYPGESTTIQLRGTAGGVVDVWADWNRDGDWSDEGEKMVDGYTFPVEIPKTVVFSDLIDVSIPETAQVGVTFMRIRLSRTGLDSPAGFGGDGEVEDYLFEVVEKRTITASGDNSDQNLGDGVCDDGTGSCSLRAAIEEANASGVPIRITFDGLGKSTTISPTSPLPAFQVPIIVEGDNALVLDGSLAGTSANGLTISSTGSSVRGLTISGFSGDGIKIDAGNRTSIVGLTIMNNGGAGVHVSSGTKNALSQNSISNNAGLGIDLGGDGVTLNDIGDSDSGANNLINYPVLTLVTAENARIEGSIDNVPSAKLTLEFFANDGCDPSGKGEGQRYVGKSVLTRGATSFSINLAEALSIGDVITATATDESGNTSEFSACGSAITTSIERTTRVEQPKAFELLQNYPNPFNPVTSIQFRLSTRSEVSLVVTDMLGKQVGRLVNGWMDSGSYTVTFDAGILPSGTYVYTLKAGSFVQSRQLTLLK